MKFIPIFLLFVIFGDVSLARNNLEDSIRAIAPLALDSKVTVEILQELTKKFIPLALKNVGNIAADGQRAPIIPPGPDPILLPDGDYTFNITDAIVGDLSVRNQEIHGLSTFEDSLELKLACEPIFGVGVIFHLDIPSLLFQGGYETDLLFLAERLTGNGVFRLGVEETNTTLNMVIGFQQGAQDKFELKALTLDLFIGKLILFAENFMFGEFPIGEDDWGAVSENIRKLIEDNWPLLQEQISTLIKDIVNDVIKDCTIIDYLNFIIGGGDLSCLRVPTIPGRLSPATYKVGETTDKTYTEFLPLLIAKAEETGFGRDIMRSILISVLDKVRASNMANMDPGQGRVSLLPPFEDPWVLPNNHSEFNLFEILQGNISLWDSVITGLSSIDDDLAFGLSLAPFGLKLNFTLAKDGNVVSALLKGNHSSAFDILLPIIQPIRAITGDGEFRAGITNAGFKIGFFAGLQTGRPTHVQISQMSMDLGYENLELFVERIFLGDCLFLPTYWQGIEDFVRWLYNLLWANNPNQQLILDFLTGTINQIIWECNIPRLLYILAGTGDTSCLSAPWQGTTTTTPRPITTTTTTTVGTTTPEITTTTGGSPTTTRTTPAPNGALNLKSLTFDLFALCIFALVCTYY